jgi:hypothetical protein
MGALKTNLQLRNLERVVMVPTEMETTRETASSHPQGQTITAVLLLGKRKPSKI